MAFRENADCFPAHAPFPFIPILHPPILPPPPSRPLPLRLLLPRYQSSTSSAAETYIADRVTTSCVCVRIGSPSATGHLERFLSRDTNRLSLSTSPSLSPSLSFFSYASLVKIGRGNLRSSVLVLDDPPREWGTRLFVWWKKKFGGIKPTWTKQTEDTELGYEKLHRLTKFYRQ